jgi:hypothetical protein
MSNLTRKKSPVFGGDADLSCVVNRTGINNTYKECFVEMGAQQYLAAVPCAEELLHPKLVKRARKFEVDTKKSVTPKLIQEAIALHMTRVAEQQQLKNQANQQKELFTHEN